MGCNSGKSIDVDESGKSVDVDPCASKIPRGTPLRYALSERLQETVCGGEIWKAQDIITTDTVIAKISPLVFERATAENPQREVSILTTLRKDSKVNGERRIIKLLDSYSLVHNGRKCLCSILEYAEGGDLMQKVLSAMETQTQRLSETEVRRYFVMIAEGVKLLHDQQICHLDLSPENIFFTKQGNVRIADFGQAETETTLHFIAGARMRQKTRYRCPEIAKKTLEYDGRKADIWSLGATLWVALTGKFCYQTPDGSDYGFRMLELGKDGITSWIHRCGGTDLSDSLIDLLSLLFKVEPFERPNIDEVLYHPWCLQGLRGLTLQEDSEEDKIKGSPSGKYSPSYSVTPSYSVL